MYLYFRMDVILSMTLFCAFPYFHFLHFSVIALSIFIQLFMQINTISCYQFRLSTFQYLQKVLLYFDVIIITIIMGGNVDVHQLKCSFNLNHFTIFYCLDYPSGVSYFAILSVLNLYKLPQFCHYYPIFFLSREMSCLAQALNLKIYLQFKL